MEEIGEVATPQEARDEVENAHSGLRHEAGTGLENPDAGMEKNAGLENVAMGSETAAELRLGNDDQSKA
uniref:Uncharacterized protein n=1 Tax=Salix viminalis TaxID=40686 RepID=A0A6N2MF28_SALVM